MGLWRTGGGGGVVEPGQVQEEELEPGVILVLRESGLFLAELLDGELDLIAAGAELRGELEFGLAGDEDGLMGEGAVGAGGVGGLADGAGALEKVGRSAAAVAIVIEERVLGGEAVFDGVEGGEGLGGVEEALQE